MCGICALFSEEYDPDGRSCVERALLRAAHRGPDSRGIISGLGDRVAGQGEHGPSQWILGHVRLAIIDLSSAGTQPMSDAERRVWLTYNGEIYNYKEVRTDLGRLGHRFVTETDTEVIIAAYRQWGDQCVDRLAGMFAFVLVDLGSRLVMAARDRCGIKPLYLWSPQGKTVVVSEPKQLLAFSDFTPRANRLQIVDFLADGVLGHIPEECCFEGVTQLPAGTVITWELGRSPDLSRKRSYWRPAAVARKLRWSDAVAETRSLFREVVRQHVRADVPIGSCLSGGIDSSSIVGVASAELGAPMHTFSSCFNGFAWDEQPYMDAVNAHCQCIATKVFPSQSELVGSLRTLAYHQDEPFGSLSVFAQWRVMQAARRAGVPVLLDGQGGDETLCGYRKYWYFFLRQLLAERRYSDLVRYSLRAARTQDGRLLQLNLGRRYLPSRLQNLNDSVVEFLRPHWKCLHRPVWQELMRGVKTVAAHQLADLRLWSLPVLLRYEDRNSMAHTVESRVPFVDHRFIEHCLSLPTEYFFRHGRKKALLIEALDGRLPAIVKERRSKLGFETPRSAWMRGHVGVTLEQMAVSSSRLGEILDLAKVKAAFERYRSGGGGHSDLTLFRIASVALWLDTFDVRI